MILAHTHLTETRVRLTTSPIVRAFSVVEERAGLDYGYLRARVELVNYDFLELAEYFVVRNDAEGCLPTLCPHLTDLSFLGPAR